MAESASTYRNLTETDALGEDSVAPTRLEAVRELRKPVPEAQAPVALKAPAAEKPAGSVTAIPVARPPRRRLTRPLLFALLPVALIAGGYFYVTGGQIMSTDNAYVRAEMVGVSTDVAGTVIAVEVHDNEAVKKGQVLYRLRPDPFQYALDGAKAQLGTVHDQIQTLYASYKMALAQIDQAEADLPYFQITFDRQQNLLATGAGTKAAFDTAQHNLEATRQKIQVAKAQADAALAQMGGDPNQKVEDNPFYLQSKSLVDQAQRDLNDTIVRAPFDGVVTNVNSIQVGSYLQTSQQAFSLVSSSNIWVEASPKETELTNVRPGQAAIVTVDTYPGISWQGIVESISPASGSSFSLLPAQNTTGNWVKVVQRIPMRVRIENLEGKPPLRVGMSVTVDVDTGLARGLPEFASSLLGHGEKAHD
jgi:membrane fusion protein (multidrug efflux system)